MENAISKTAASIQARQQPAPTQSRTSTSTLRSDVLTDEQRRAVNYLYARVKTVYGSKYKAQFPSEADEQLSKREWAGQVMNLSREDIDRGIGKLKALLVEKHKDYQWPNIPLIAAQCQPQPEDFGMPNGDDAWTEAEKYCHAVNDHPWSHEAVRIAGKRTGWFEIMSSVNPERRKKLAATFERHYRYLMRRVMEGKPLKDAQMLIESDKRKEPPSLSRKSQDYHAQQHKEQMKAMEINPAGGRDEFLKMKKRLAL